MAKQMMDIGLDVDGDLLIDKGDFVIRESTAEHQRSIILDAPGEYKYAPLVGVGAVEFLDDENPANIMREISQQFMRDGMEIIDLKPNPASFTDNTEKIFSNAFYR